MSDHRRPGARCMRPTRRRRCRRRWPRGHVADPAVGSPAVDRSDWADDDPAAFRPPLPPEDRLWRHPSELGGAGGAALGSTPAAKGSRTRLAVTVGVIAAGALVIAGLASIVLGPARRASEATASTLPGPAAALPPIDDTGVVRLEVSTVDGTRDAMAVVVEGTGFLATTLGAVAEATELAALLPDGRRAVVTVAGTDEESGAAVLRVADAPAPARTGQASSLNPGDAVATVGPNASQGRVVDLGVSAEGPLDTTLHHLLAVELGDESAVREGEPLVDTSGAIVALCTRSQSGDVLGVSAEAVRAAARSMAASGRLIVPWLGVSGKDHDGTAVVASVRAGSPASKGGVAVGDAILALDGQPIQTMSTLALLVRDRRVGEELVLLVRRDGAELAVSVTLGEKPAGS